MTILIPAKNAQVTIRRALLSVANQTSREWDVQLLIDCSTTDNTYRKANKVKQELSSGKKIHINVSRRPGLPWVYKELIDRAEPTDDACGFLDADDQLALRAVARIRPFYVTDPDVGHVWSQFCHNPGGHKGWSRPLPSGRSLREAFSGGWWGAQHWRTFRKSVYTSSGYELQLDIPYATDFNLALVLAATDCKANFVADVLYSYHKTPGGITMKSRSKQSLNCRELRKRFRRWCKGNKCVSSSRRSTG